jgi:hypothetical protein
MTLPVLDCRSKTIDAQEFRSLLGTSGVMNRTLLCASLLYGQSTPSEVEFNSDSIWARLENVGIGFDLPIPRASSRYPA